MNMPVPAGSARGLIRLWIACLAALVFAMVVVGGATRLTQSGLSIVEWKPVTGVVPPLSQAQWQAEFDKYKTIPQYQRVNRGMSLDEFKTIFWWEWSHRLLGRLLGAVFLLPFVFFLWRGLIDRRLAGALVGIFALGAVQGAVGWWMVSSGLTERVVVSQYRLAFHLTLACLIYAALVVTADRYAARPLVTPVPRRIGVHRRGPRRARHCANLSRRAGRGPSCRAHLQHLAADRRRARSRPSRACCSTSRHGGISSRTRSPCSSIIACSPTASSPSRSSMSSMSGATSRDGRCGSVRRCSPGSSVRRLRSASSRWSTAAPLALAMLHQSMALVVLTVATLHASHAVASPAPSPARRLASGY